MFDPETGTTTPDAEIRVYTTTRMFGDDVAYHVVPVAHADAKRGRLFERKPKRLLGRQFDETNNLLHTSECRNSFDRGFVDPTVPVHEHAGLDAYFAAIGYSWSRNSYKQTEPAAQAA